MTLSARAATAAARHLTQAELGRYLERLAEIRDTGTPTQSMQAARIAESWLRLALAIPEGDDAILGVDPRTMTREQRAAERAAILGLEPEGAHSPPARGLSRPGLLTPPGSKPVTLGL